MPALELTVNPDPAADALAIALGIVDIVLRLNRIDLALGGAGFSTPGNRQEIGTVTLTMTPMESEGAPHRLNQVCLYVNGEAPQPGGLHLPASLRSMSARVV